MTEREAEECMVEFEEMWCCGEPTAMLKYLHQLHKTRDAAIYMDLRFMCALARDTVTLLKIDEMY